MKATNTIMKLVMNTGKEFTFYVDNEEHFDNVHEQLCSPDTKGKVQCIPTLTVDPKYVISIEKYFEELKD